MSLGAINDTFLSHWSDISAKLRGVAVNEEIDGKSLDLATVIAVARYGAASHLSDESIKAVVKSAQMVQDSIDKGEVVYGETNLSRAQTPRLTTSQV